MSIFFITLSTIMLAAAFLLVRDGYLLASENITPSCDVNPFFSCGNIFSTWQAQVFLSTPNPVYGLIGYTIMLTIFVATFQKAVFKPWFWRIFTIGVILAWGFLMWLFYQSVFTIGFLCLYCIIVWVIHTIFLFVFIPAMLKNNLIKVNEKVSEIGAKILPYMWVPIVLVFIIMIISVGMQFPLLFV